MAAWLGQYCIEVRDLERSVALFDALGLECTSRTEVPQAFEAIVEQPLGGSKLQLAQRKDKAFALGNGFWKLYVNTRDVADLHPRALEAGCTEVIPPTVLDRWPVTMSYVEDPDGYLIELVERRPWGDDAPATPVWLGQYCLNVSDLEVSVAFYELLGLACTSRTDIEHAREAIVEHPGRGSKLQLAQHLEPDPLSGRDRAAERPIDPGSVWKLYVNTDDCAALHSKVVGAGYSSDMAPTHLDRWPVTIAFVTDPDGYQVELVERDPG